MNVQINKRRRGITRDCFDEGEKDSERKGLVMARGARPQAKPGPGQQICAEVILYSSQKYVQLPFYFIDFRL